MKKEIKKKTTKKSPVKKKVVKKTTKKERKKVEIKIPKINFNKGSMIYLIYIVPIILLIVGIIVGTTIVVNKQITTNNDDSTTIELDMNPDNGDEKINWSKYETQDIRLTESLVIKKGGTYNLSGTIGNGSILIDTTEDVKLIFNNIRITNLNGPAINVKNAENLVIVLPENTTSVLNDSKKYNGIDVNIKGCIHADADLVFEGPGTLEINANYKDGISAKKDLKFVGGTYKITSDDDAIKGKNSVNIKDGEFIINAKGIGIKSTSTKSEKGFIKINKGIFNITSTLDAIKAENDILIKGGEFTIKTGGGSNINSASSSNWGYWGQKSTKEDMTSAKGIYAKDNILIESGKFTLDTSDDAIHAGNHLGITDGQFEISSGDDAIHATNELIYDNGLINITASYEGIEASRMTINGGTINIVAIDDGINIAGGKDLSSQKRPGAGLYNKRLNNTLIVNNGTIYINSAGDGIDLNGSGYIYGGYIVVDGPENSKNGALDYDKELVVDGGTVMAGGASGMARSISSSSKQPNLFIGLNTTIDKGNIIILDKDNKEVVKYEVKKKLSTLVVSSDKLVKDETYKIMVDDHEYAKFTIKTTTTQIGNGGNKLDK